MGQINEAFNSPQIQKSPNPIVAADDASEIVNKYWSKWIPLANKIFIGIALFIFFGVDLFILVTDSMDLGTGIVIMIFFYGIMFIPMLVFYGFYRYENQKLADKYLTSSSKIDPWILVMVSIRDIVFILSVIPFIQILGMAALVFEGIPYLIVYYFLLRARSRTVVSAV